MDLSSSSSKGGAHPPALSVVIGVRNWGLDRLEVALRSHLASIVDNVEIVISDYGSENRDEVFSISQRYSCEYIYTEADVWSRSAALNAGIQISRSNNILTTDADIIFSPKAHQTLLRNLTLTPESIQIIQCRDLPEGYGAENLPHFDWETIFKASSIRPRWGMGGSATFTRSLFARLHGFDERMTVWGGEDNDFVQRARRSGAILNWVEDPEAQIYHIWHAPDSRGVSPAGTKTVEQNKKILQEDRSTVRNLSRSFHRSRAYVPTVSIVIATKDRPDLLGESITSALRQTFEDFEILIIDDGSKPELKAPLNDFDDSRVKIVSLDESRGFGFARNYANAIAQGEFIAIHDDDNLMLPQRLEQQLGAITEDVAGSYGGWISFDDQTGALVAHPGHRTFDLPSMTFGSPPGHSTVLVRRQVLDFYRYNENFPANAGYHLLTRVARGGVRLAHCGHYVSLHRLNAHNPSGMHNSLHDSSVGIAKAMLRSTWSADLDQQNRKTSKANVQVDIPFAEVIAATRYLPARLQSTMTRIEFGGNPPSTDIASEALAEVLKVHREINIEFDTSLTKGIRAVTVATDSMTTSQDLASTLSNLGSIQSVSEMTLPAIYSDLSKVEASIKIADHQEQIYVDVGSDIEGLLRILERHTNRCFLRMTEEPGYQVGLPQLQPPVEALVRAKLKRFRAIERLHPGG